MDARQQVFNADKNPLSLLLWGCELSAGFASTPSSDPTNPTGCPLAAGVSSGFVVGLVVGDSRYLTSKLTISLKVRLFLVRLVG